ncbi:hypothetical protein SDC9_165642 [bioreactor metagenome]|uniref:Uncharacterized protein n=1 Tax=bioreactor metagenome TaxID=1076179 RepID=A0A645FX46_9ZZZZ
MLTGGQAQIATVQRNFTPQFTPRNAAARGEPADRGPWPSPRATARFGSELSRRRPPHRGFRDSGLIRSTRCRSLPRTSPFIGQTCLTGIGSSPGPVLGGRRRRCGWTVRRQLKPCCDPIFPGSRAPHGATSTS